ncbi:MAG TPA: hypothetical protein VNS32_15605 [Flavisolibacter sp.]|nr:hypothetical protein [Flavisolibacter sp.]
MIEENSGKIHRFKLDFNLGFCYCIQFDFTDITKFSGKLIYVYDLISTESTCSINIEQLTSSSFLFGPKPLLKFPHIKGKGAWEYIGKIDNLIKPRIIFKSVRDNYTMKDWTKLKGWHKYEDFETVGVDCNYEEIRYLELPVLYGTSEIEIRSTMHILLLNKKRVNDYYDLEDLHLRNIYIQTVNSSFKLDEANKFLNEIK